MSAKRRKPREELFRLPNGLFCPKGEEWFWHRVVKELRALTKREAGRGLRFHFCITPFCSFYSLRF